MDAQTFWDGLKGRGLNFFAGVPDSIFQNAYNVMVNDPEIRYVPAVREDVALGIASAAYFAGRLGGVVMQNSGVGNIVNPLTSFSLMYKIPVLLIVGWRGHDGPPNDAPEHWIMGVTPAPSRAACLARRGWPATRPARTWLWRGLLRRPAPEEHLRSRSRSCLMDVYTWKYTPPSEGSLPG